MRHLLTIAALATSIISSALAEPSPPPPPTTLTELKKNPGGLEQVSGDLRENYGGLPVTAVYKRESERVTVSYLVNGETIFGYRFEFKQPGSASDLWQESINQFVSRTFPKDSYRHDPGTISGINNDYFRTDHVLNVAAYEEAKKAYAAAETLRLQQQSFGNATPAVEKTAEEEKAKPKAAKDKDATAAHVPLSIADYQKRFPDTTPATAIRGKVPGFEFASIGDMPVDSYYTREAGNISALILVNRGTVIGYVVKVRASGSNYSLWQRSVEASLKTTFPDSAYTRIHLGTEQPFAFYQIVDKAANKAACDAYIAEETATMKALLGP